jgi:hypothetical protein
VPGPCFSKYLLRGGVEVTPNKYSEVAMRVFQSKVRDIVGEAVLSLKSVLGGYSVRV